MISGETGLSINLPLPKSGQKGKYHEKHVQNGQSVIEVVVPLLAFTLVSQAGAQTCVQLPEGLISWWSGDGNADDLVGTNDGALQNGATFAPGQVVRAFSFDGADDYVTVGSNVNLANSSFTVEAWSKRASSGTNDMILGQGVALANQSLHFGLRDNGDFTCAFYENDLDVVGLSAGLDSLGVYV